MPTLPKNSVYEVSPLHPQLWRADCTMPFYRKNFGICGVGGGGVLEPVSWRYGGITVLKKEIPFARDHPKGKRVLLCRAAYFCVLSDCSVFYQIVLWDPCPSPTTEQWFSNFWAPKRTPRCLIIDSLTPWPEILIHKSQRICIFCQYSRCWFGQRVL